MTATDEPRLPDTEVANALIARIFAEESETIANHSVRSYLFADEFARANNLAAGSDFDERQLFAACILHDMGLTDAGNGDQRFEVDGADYAARILAEHGYTEAETRAVWEAIALHCTPTVAERWNTLTLLVRSGVGMDFGRGADIVAPARMAAISERYPLLQLERTLVGEIIDQAEANLLKAPRSSFTDILMFERSVSDITRMELGAAARYSA